MDEYAIYFEVDGSVYRLPVNPEDITRSQKMDTEQYRMLTGNQISVPVGRALDTISFEAEFPYDARTYSNKGFRSVDFWEKTFKAWQTEKKVVRFIASNGVHDNISLEVLVTQVKTVEQAEEDGDKYISLELLEYAAPTKRYVAVQKMKKSQSGATHPSVAGGKTHTVVKGDTLWGIAKKYYGNGSQYSKIYNANAGKIKNPNLIYPGQVLSIPS